MALFSYGDRTLKFLDSGWDDRSRPDSEESIREETPTAKRNKSIVKQEEEKELTDTMLRNHDCFVSALRNYAGQTLTTGQIQRILLAVFPDFNVGSILPNDHAEGNECPCGCAGTVDRVFDRIHRGLYRVRLQTI